MARMKMEDYINEGTRVFDPNPEARKFFSNISQPSMTELVSWFQTEFVELSDAMKNSDHASAPGEVNAYHVEGTVWAHTMMVCHEARFDHKVNKIAALLHDVGKPLAREVIPMDAPKPSMNGEERKSTVELKATPGAKFKTHFRGHEGISFWYSIDPLYELVRLGVITKDEMEEILHIISLHGTLFNRIKDGEEHKPEQVTRIFDEVEKFERFVKQSRNDSLGRFYNSGAGSRADVGAFLGHTLYNADTYLNNPRVENGKGTSTPFIHVLVGLPASGKSTFIKEVFADDVTVISKDTVIMEMGEELGLSEYTDIYKALTKEQHDEAYKETMRRFQEAQKGDRAIVIDMTNMSKKSRGKWINNVGKKFKTKAWVFVAGTSVLTARNLLRTQQENKFIPQHVYTNMMKSFLVPTLYEFDFVQYVFQD